MFLLFKVLDKKYKGMLFDKIFDMLNIMFLYDNLFELKHNDKYNIKMIKIVKTMIKKIINDNFVVKIDKKTLSIVDKFNKLQKKYNAKCLKDDIVSESDSDSDSESESCSGSCSEKSDDEKHKKKC
jgi:hypothetical protein